MASSPAPPHGAHASGGPALPTPPSQQLLQVSDQNNATQHLFWHRRLPAHRLQRVLAAAPLLLLLLLLLLAAAAAATPRRRRRLFIRLRRPPDGDVQVVQHLLELQRAGALKLQPATPARHLQPTTQRQPVSLAPDPAHPPPSPPPASLTPPHLEQRVERKTQHHGGKGEPDDVKAPLQCSNGGSGNQSVRRHFKQLQLPLLTPPPPPTHTHTARPPRSRAPAAARPAGCWRGSA